MKSSIKTYTELSKIPTFEGRLEYLRQRTRVGELRFGHARYLNQEFYTSPEWKRVRRKVIARDNGCDMGLKDYPIFGRIIVHHIEEIKIEDIENGSDKLFDMNNLICVSNETHQAITYGSSPKQIDIWHERTPNDLTPWRAK